MVSMTRRHIPMLVVAAAAAISLLAPAVASARLSEIGLGADNSLGTPSCPSSPCLAITRTTGYQLVLGSRRNVFVAPRSGRIVAFTLRLGKPTTKQVDFFDQQSGGKSQVRLAILRPVASRVRGQILYKLNAQTDPLMVEKYFGTDGAVPALHLAADQEGLGRRAQRAHVGPGARGQRPRQHVRVARQPREAVLEQPRATAAAHDAGLDAPVLLHVPAGAADVQRDADLHSLAPAPAPAA